VELVVRMSESKCAERKRREILCGSRAEWHETRERAQCTDEGSCLMPTVVTLAG